MNKIKYTLYNQEQAFQHMARKRSDKEKLLYLITDDVLFTVWDPCCLSIGQEYREEYLPYLPNVFDLLSSTETGLDLYDYLVFIEKTQYDAYENDALIKRRSSRVVDLLLEYRDIIFHNGKRSCQVPDTQLIDHPEFYPA